MQNCIIFLVQSLVGKNPMNRIMAKYDGYFLLLHNSLGGNRGVLQKFHGRDLWRSPNPALRQNRTHWAVLFPTKNCGKTRPGRRSWSVRGAALVLPIDSETLQCHAQRCFPNWGNLRGAEGAARGLQLMRQELMGPKTGAVKSKLPSLVKEPSASNGDQEHCQLCRINKT